MKRVLVVGELNVDLVFRNCCAFPAPGKEVLAEDAIITPGSSSMTCAMGLARLGNQVVFVGKVGVDNWGDICMAALQDAGVDVSAVQRDAALRTGITASFSTPQDRALVTFVGATSALRSEDVGDDQLAAVDHVHVSSYFLQHELRPGCRRLFERARIHGLSTSLDPGFDPAERWGSDLVETLREVDLFLPNDVELGGITGRAELLDGLHSLNGHTRTVAKRGRLGCATLQDGQLLEAPAFAVAPVDSTGAGDSFDAGFIHAWLQRMTLIDCMRWGNACGSLSTRGVGGTTRQADAADVMALFGAVS